MLDLLGVLREPGKCLPCLWSADSDLTLKQTRTVPFTESPAPPYAQVPAAGSSSTRYTARQERIHLFKTPPRPPFATSSVRTHGWDRGIFRVFRPNAVSALLPHLLHSL